MSRLTVNTNDLESEGLDIEDVILEGGNLETAAEVDLEGGDLEVGIGGGGADGVGIQSIEQTVTSTEDGGINEVTQTLTDGTTAVFQIRNGSRGSQGLQGERGEKGDAGEDWIPTQHELASIAQSAAQLVQVPDELADLNDDSTHRLVTDTEKSTWNGKQAQLVSGTNIKTINNESILGEGNINIQGGTGGDVNVIEVVKVNGTALTPDSNKAVDVPVPTEQTVSGWGFTKNTGTYSKPSGGIPKTDLASSVQTSLGKADTALQSFTETDPTVPSWAKQPTKPSYTASEVGALPSSTTIPTKTSDLTNDSGFITGYTETDPTVPSWAKQSTKPTYTASEVGALPASTTIPSALADLSDDSTHRTVTDTEKSNWNSKGTYSKPSGGIPASDIASGVIPTNCVSSTDITNVVYLTQAAYDALATKDSNTLYIIPES